jgi:tetratricopeptide (TPR) repeat protein
MASTSGAVLILPRGLLRRPDFVTACGARDFAAVFAMVRKYAGISQVRIAAALDMTPSRVGEVIRRQRQITSLDVIERISDRLRIPGWMLGLAPRPWERADASGDPGETALSDIAAILGDEHLEPTVESAVRTAHRWLTVEPPQLRELRAGRHVGSGLVHRVKARTSHLRRMDDVIGGRDSFAIVTREVDATAALLREGNLTEPTRAALLAALAELCQLAGWVLDDAGRHEHAIPYYVVGARAAECAEDRPLAADLLSTLSYSRANAGHATDAVLLAKSAAITGESHAPPVGRALLWDRAAWAHAKNGDADLCLRALEAAEEAFARADEDERPTWAYWLDPRELAVLAGRCLTELDQPDGAEPLLLDALAGYDATHVREVALYRSWLGEAYAKVGDVERGCAETMRVLDAMEGVNSARVEGRVVVLRRALRPFADVAAVREVEERSQAIIKTACPPSTSTLAALHDSNRARDARPTEAAVPVLIAVEVLLVAVRPPQTLVVSHVDPA